MRIICIYILLIIIAACKNKLVEKPVWINNASCIELSNTVLKFSSNSKGWQATLLGFLQPMPLIINYNDTGFNVQLLFKEGVIEGPAKIVLNNGKQYFYYEVLLVNKKTIVTKKDYRSSKTVNLDSSLQQQSILHYIDENRNIVNYNNNYFDEAIITLSPKVGTFDAIENEPLTAYYVQAGSCNNIIVNAILNKEKNIFVVTTVQLKDVYNNVVSNGTSVSFLYSDGLKNYQTKAPSINGIATVYIPVANKNFKLFAKVDQTFSNTITLTPQ